MKLAKFKCTVCGWIYDEDKEGTPFEELPDDWVCPECGAPKDAFEKMKEAPKKPGAPPKKKGK